MTHLLPDPEPAVLGALAYLAALCLIGAGTTRHGERLAVAIDHLNRAIGRAASWLVVAMVALQATLVLLRYVYGVAPIQLQEAVLYAHGAMFLLVAAETLRSDDHVRVDVLYARATPRQRASIDLAGTVLLLLPVIVTLGVVALPYVSASWAVREGSREAAGIPAVYLLKSVILVFVAQMALQAVSLGLRSLQRLRL